MKKVHIDEGVGNAVKATVNKELTNTLKKVVRIISEYLQGKAENIPEAIERLFNSPEAEQEKQHCGLFNWQRMDFCQ